MKTKLNSYKVLTVSFCLKMTESESFGHDGPEPAQGQSGLEGRCPHCGWPAMTVSPLVAAGPATAAANLTSSQVHIQ